MRQAIDERDAGLARGHIAPIKQDIPARLQRLAPAAHSLGVRVQARRGERGVAQLHGAAGAMRQDMNGGKPPRARQDP